jgi:hypothetical protein
LHFFNILITDILEAFYLTEGRIQPPVCGYYLVITMNLSYIVTSAFLLSMILSLVAFPQTQKKAHEEIDRVIGQDRAPRLEDFDNLPYCQALINEVHRCRLSQNKQITHFSH